MAKSIVGDTLGWGSKDLTAMAEALGLDGENARVLSLEFTHTEWENNAKIREAVAYIGFDAKKIVEQFFKKAGENPVQSGDKLTNYGEVQLYDKNDAKTDLLFFLKVFLERGNNLHKALLRCDDAIAPILRRKASAYGINIDKTQGRGILGTRQLTLARIAQAFAQCTATLILKDNIKSKLTSKLFTGLPTLMLHTVFPALIPINLGETTETIKLMAILINIEISFLLADAKEKRRMSTRPLEDLMEQSRLFVDAAMNGSLIGENAKTSIMIKAEIMTMDTVKKVITAADTIKAQATRLQTIKAHMGETMSSVLNHLVN